MKISRITINRVENHPQVKAICSLTFDNMIIINLITLLYMKNQYYIAMPTRKEGPTINSQICYPASYKFKEYIKDAIVRAYESKQDNVVFNDAFEKPSLNYELTMSEKNRVYEGQFKICFDDSMYVTGITAKKENGNTTILFPYRKKKNGAIIKFCDFLKGRKEYYDTLTDAFENAILKREKTHVKEVPPGVQTILNEMKRVYPDQTNPLKFESTIYKRSTLENPLNQVLVYDGGDYWHFVTFGLSDLSFKTINDPDNSGFGMEFTFKLKKDKYKDADREIRTINKLLQLIASVTFKQNELFLPYQLVDIGAGPIDYQSKSNIVALITVPDQTLNTVYSEFGRVRFVEFVGITEAELEYLKENGCDKQHISEFFKHLGSDVTKYNRKSIW